MKPIQLRREGKPNKNATASGKIISNVTIFPKLF